MTETCPNCSSSCDDSDPHNHDEKTDGQGYWWSTSDTYTCNECGCEFTVTEETKKTIEVTKEGRQVDD